MFTLRQKSHETGEEINRSLGDQYSILYRERSPEQWKKNEYVEVDTAYAVILYSFGNEGRAITLHKGSGNYIMTERGKTFDNVSYQP